MNLYRFECTVWVRGDSREEALKELHVVLVQCAVAAQIAECGVGQAEFRLDELRDVGRELTARAFQHVHHAEEADRIAAVDVVVDVADEQLDRPARRARLLRHSLPRGRPLPRVARRREIGRAHV